MDHRVSLLEIDTINERKVLHVDLLETTRNKEKKGRNRNNNPDYRRYAFKFFESIDVLYIARRSVARSRGSGSGGTWTKSIESGSARK